MVVSKALIKKWLAKPNVTEGKMFGWDCLKVNGNVFIAWSDEGYNFKLNEESRVEALKIKGAGHFDPMKNGSAMREWVLINKATEAQLSSFAKQAYNFVKVLPEKELFVKKLPDKKKAEKKTPELKTEVRTIEKKIPEKKASVSKKPAKKKVVVKKQTAKKVKGKKKK